jgi:hypothetical protein
MKIPTDIGWSYNPGKATRSGKTLFMVSFRRVDDIKREVERLKRKKNVKIIKDEL